MQVQVGWDAPSANAYAGLCLARLMLVADSTITITMQVRTSASS